MLRNPVGVGRNGQAAGRRLPPPIPTGLRISAQGCGPTATLGIETGRRFNPNGVVDFFFVRHYSATPLGLGAMVRRQAEGCPPQSQRDCGFSPGSRSDRYPGYRDGTAVQPQRGCGRFPRPPLFRWCSIAAGNHGVSFFAPSANLKNQV